MDLPEPVDITTLPETPLESSHLNHNDLPWVDQGWGIEFKILRVCNETGSWIIMNRFPPGTQLPKHHWRMLGGGFNRGQYLAQR